MEDLDPLAVLIHECVAYGLEQDHLFYCLVSNAETDTFDKCGRRTQEVPYLERPIHKLVLIQPQNREFRELVSNESQLFCLAETRLDSLFSC